MESTVDVTIPVDAEMALVLDSPAPSGAINRRPRRLGHCPWSTQSGQRS